MVYEPSETQFMPTVALSVAKNTRVISEIYNIKTNTEGTLNRFGKYESSKLEILFHSF
jgi:hypothetical protein